MKLFPEVCGEHGYEALRVTGSLSFNHDTMIAAGTPLFLINPDLQANHGPWKECSG